VCRVLGARRCPSFPSAIGRSFCYARAVSTNYQSEVVFDFGTQIGAVFFLDAGLISDWYRTIEMQGNGGSATIEVSSQVRPTSETQAYDPAFRDLPDLISTPGDFYIWDFLQPRWNLLRVTVVSLPTELEGGSRVSFSGTNGDV